VSIAVYILLVATIAVLWLLVGYYEWQPSASLEKRIGNLCKARVKDSYQKLEMTQLVLNIAYGKEILPELEKNIYLWRKKQKNSLENYVIKLYIRSAGGIDQKEIKKAKLKLEHRFRGLTVYYSETGEEHVILYPEG